MIPMGEGKDTQIKVLKALGISSTIGTGLAASVFIGYYIGTFLDEKWGTEPLFLLIGILVGMGLGIWGTIELLTNFWKEK
jgi:ATP synthase protein I